MNGNVTFVPTTGFVGEIVIETSVALVTDSVALPVTLPTDAVIVVVPAPRPVATPELETEATLGLDEAQVAESVTSW